MGATRDWSTEIEVLCGQLKDHYFNSDVAEQVSALLRRRLVDGSYADLPRDEDFAAAVTGDMQRVNGDKHLYLAYTTKKLAPAEDPVIHDGPRDPRAAGLDGHGFHEVQRLPGNVWYLDVRRFWHPDLSGPAAVAVMNLVADADALIVDLRLCTGGEPEMVALVCGYLFDEPTQLNTLTFPAEGRTVQFWSSAYVPGPRFGGQKPIFVLIGSSTFSAAEAISYDLQQYRRATLIGQRTAGGANFHFPMRVADHLFSAVPSGYPLHPVSGANWEGVGVEPDITVPEEDAVAEAKRRSLEHVLSLGADGPRRAVAEQAEQELRRLRAGAGAPGRA
ncbi:S41 family peptidase [Verrucosispora sp. WMMD573]|nr:S41 family peptidase [Verrucosispora sp. WMMD573]WBB57572.1 S41 family peptidase [Verrucosispora sp. WMMD573]